MKHKKPVKPVRMNQTVNSQYRSWSPDRPVKANLEDQLADQLFSMLEAKQGRVWDWSNVSGLSETTIRNYKAKRTQRPQAMSLQMLARALGGQIIFVKEARKK